MKNLVVALTLLASCNLPEPTSRNPSPATQDAEGGFVRHDFREDNTDVIIFEPATPLPGRPWAWRR